MLAAMIDVVVERGASNATVAHVVNRAGVSRRTFYELFEGGEDCFLAAFDYALERAARPVVEAYERERRWRERVRAGLAALLRFLQEEPTMGRLLIVESLAAGPGALERRGRVLETLIAAVDEGRAESKPGREPPPLTAEGIVGATLSVIHARLSQARPGRLTASLPPALGGPHMGELLNPLMSMVVLPYLGPAAARGELSRPAVEPPARPAPVHSDLLHELPMRITYRTIRVLSAVGATPGASNRAVGDAAGIADQGQVSKLLARLRRLGLIENTRDSMAHGMPNVWRLTPRGADVESAIRVHSDRADR
jgi:AcrR family transcriptional regulator/DNA-binding MarR family transcriptional regulator